ncbi:MAG: chemotaxis protein CheX [Fibrobacter sp.]|nr:chemotaxis protein CheX [Fibrobacter sp.]
MDVSYINPFINATIDCFKTMITSHIEPLKPCLKKFPYALYDISGVIGLSGKAQGSISFGFSQENAVNIVSSMLKAEISDTDPDLPDAIGEIANIIAGNAKKELSRFKLSISLPNVIIGKKHSLGGEGGAPTILVPFTTTAGDFVMEVSLKTK